MTKEEVAKEFKPGTRVKVLEESAYLYGEYAWVHSVSHTDVLVKSATGYTEWIDASGDNIKKAKDQVPPS